MFKQSCLYQAQLPLFKVVIKNAAFSSPAITREGNSRMGLRQLIFSYAGPPRVKCCRSVHLVYLISHIEIRCGKQT